MLSLAILLKKNSGRSGMDFHVPRELMYFSLYFTCGAETERVASRSPSGGKPVILEQFISTADLADVVGEFAVAHDVQGVLVGVIVALGKLKGLLVTQLKEEENVEKGHSFLTTYLSSESENVTSSNKDLHC